jgi:DNA-binding MarR family transcriptional regulator
MQLEDFQALVRMFVEPILAEVFPGETGAARMQQIGLLTVILMLQNTGEPVTAARIAEMSGQVHSQVHRNLQKLLKLGIVERVKVKNRAGKGQAWDLRIKHTPQTRKLLDAMQAGFKSR